MSSHAGPARRAGRLTVLYVACWGCLAVAAAAYLGMLALNPEIASRLVKIKRTAPPDAVPTEAQRNVSRALAELQDVRRSLSQVRDDVDGVKEVLAAQEHVDRTLDALRSEVGGIKTSLASGSDRDRELSARVAAIESRQAMTEDEDRRHTAQVADTQRRSPQATSSTITGSVAERSRHVAATTAGKQPPAPRRAPGKQASAAAMPSFGAARVTAVAKPKSPSPVGLHLATGLTLDELRLTWLRISTSNRSTLQSFDPVYAETRRGGKTRYRLMVGPYGDAADAARACGALKANKFRCSLTAYSGQPL